MKNYKNEIIERLQTLRREKSLENNFNKYVYNAITDCISVVEEVFNENKDTEN